MKWWPRLRKYDIDLEMPGLLADVCSPIAIICQKSLANIPLDIEFIDVSSALNIPE